MAYAIIKLLCDALASQSFMNLSTHHKVPMHYELQHMGTLAMPKLIAKPIAIKAFVRTSAFMIQELSLVAAAHACSTLIALTLRIFWIQAAKLEIQLGYAADLVPGIFGAGFKPAAEFLSLGTKSVDELIEQSRVSLADTRRDYPNSFLKTWPDMPVHVEPTIAKAAKSQSISFADYRFRQGNPFWRRKNRVHPDHAVIFWQADFLQEVDELN